MPAVCCECLSSSLFSDPKELKRLRRNWLNQFAVSSLGGLCYFISIPSLHQFVTSSSTPADPNIQPGLGLSETWYTWTVSIASVGELIGAVSVGLLSRRLYIKWLILTLLFIGFCGGLLFGIGKYGWMLLIGRLLIGIFQGAQQTAWRIYIAETSVKSIKLLPEDRRVGSAIKHTNFFIVFAIATTSIAAGPSMAAVVANIPVIDQFRWPGWFICGAASFLFVLTLVLFREKWEDINRKGGTCGIQDTRIPYYAIVFIIIAFILANWQFAVLDTLLNPILADNFGLNIEYISYIFMSLLVLYLVGICSVYTLQRLHVNIRIICLISFTASLTGSLISTDWQSIGRRDPCNQLPLPHSINSTIANPVLLLNDTNCYSINITDSDPSLLSCSMSCDSMACDLLRNLSAVIETANSLPCLLDTGILSCYNSSSRHFIQLVADEYLDYYDFVDVPIDNVCPVTPGDYRHDDILLVVHFTRQILCDSSYSSFDNIEQLWAQCSYVNDSSQCFCEGSRDQYKCFWNPMSRVNGKYCERCRPICLSEDHTLHFAQLIIGAIFLAPCYPMARMSLTILASDGLGEASQSLVMGVMVAAGAVARFSGPLWGNSSYLYAGHRTWLSMTILSICQGIVIAIFLILYRKLERKKVAAVKLLTDDDNSDSITDSDLSSASRDNIELLTFNSINNEDHDNDGDVVDDDVGFISDENRLLASN